MVKMSEDLIVVFNKDVSEEDAEAILKEHEGISFKSGMDSSRGKVYFYSTGPKFIVTVESDKRSAFLNNIKENPDLHEIYVADWEKTKD